MPKTKRYTFVVSYDAAVNRNPQGFLNMMSFDACQVLAVDSNLIVLGMTDVPPTTDRWAGFGIYVLAQQEGDYPDLYRLKDKARNSLPPAIRPSYFSGKG